MAYTIEELAKANDCEELNEYGLADVDSVFPLLHVKALEQRPIKPTASARKACNKVFF